MFEAMFHSENWPLAASPFWAVLFFALGGIVGSFLNVCIHRLPRGMSIVTPPSHCPHCQYSIPWYLNIPLVTWLALRGRCKNCGAPISPRYFAVELLTGAAFLACWLDFGQNSPGRAVVYALFLAGLIAATFIDFEHFIIPDEITVGGLLAGFVTSLLMPSLQDARSLTGGMVRSLLGAAVGAGIVYAILRLGKWLFGRQRLHWPPETKFIFTETSLHLPDRDLPYEEVFYRKSDAIVVKARRVELIDRGYGEAVVRLSPTRLRIEPAGAPAEEWNPECVPCLEATGSDIVLPREAMGLGDVKFMAAIGAFIGWPGVVFSLAVSSMIGAAVGVGLIALRRREWSSRMPYGPYIALAAVLWIFGGKEIFYGLPW
ncbi:MAG: prepilin peptidase [Verrucomicrobiota bacterium]|nr:prepilin peptidase [Verrucomicrobiota bacterium]